MTRAPILPDVGFGHLEHIAVEGVEPVGDVTSQLHMLLLILAHGHIVRLVEQDVSGHQAGVGEQTCVDVVGVLGALVLELGHPGQLPEHGVAAEHPAQLGVLGDMALDEQGVLFRIQAAGNVLRQLLHGAPAQVSGSLTHGDGVQIRHKIVTVKGFRPFRPILDGTQVRAEGQITAGLDTGKHDFFFIHVNTTFFPFPRAKAHRQGILLR